MDTLERIHELIDLAKKVGFDNVGIEVKQSGNYVLRFQNCEKKFESKCFVNLSELEKFLEFQRTYSVGDWFEDEDRTKYVLAQVRVGKVALIGIGRNDVNRYKEPVLVEHIRNITHEEASRIGILDMKKIKNPLF